VLKIRTPKYLARALAPGVNRVAYVFHSEIGPYYPLWLKSVEAPAATLGIEATAAPVRAVADIERVISIIAAAPNGGLIVQPDGYTGCRRSTLIAMRLQRAALHHTGRMEST
jgi:hypothetical protein